MEPWRTAITDSDEENIWIRGYDIGSLMQKATFAEPIFLLHLGRMPSSEEGKLLDAVLISSSDHGPGSPSAATARLACSGNRKSLSSAIAAGVLAIGDEHGGAGMACMELIATGNFHDEIEVHLDRRSSGSNRRRCSKPKDPSARTGPQGSQHRSPQAGSF